MHALIRDPLAQIRKLSEVGVALSAEKDTRRLMELILDSAMELTRADGGTLYSRDDENRLHFEILITDSLGVRLGGSSGRPVGLPALNMFEPDGSANDHMVAVRAAVTGRTVNIADAYHARGYDFSGTREFDARTGYRSTSFLTVPLRDHEDRVNGVLQLINARDPGDGETVPFGKEDELLAESLASQAAIALTKKELIDEQRALFDAFIELIAGAIDDKSPYTGGHCRRVPELTMMLAEAAAATREGPLRGFRMREEDRYELRIAGWLHDCGKVTTPEWVVDKATKLETLFDRMALVESRFQALHREAEIRMLHRRMEALERGEVPDDAGLAAELAAERAALDDDLAFLCQCNQGSEHMSAEDAERVRQIARRTWTDGDGRSAACLSEDEVYNLTVEHGTLTPEERTVVNHHIDTTIRMLESLPYPRHLRRVPAFAGAHHERMDGRGYPRGLTREQMPVQARIMGIADIFEALTAADRPYKRPMPLSEALHLLGRMRLDNHIDPDLFDVFIREKVYLRYAERFLPPEQIDAVDEAAIPGYGADT